MRTQRIGKNDKISANGFITLFKNLDDLIDEFSNRYEDLNNENLSDLYQSMFTKNLVIFNKIYNYLHNLTQYKVN